MKVWVPVDAYVGLSLSKQRLLHVPTVVGFYPDSDRRAWRIELWLLVHATIVLDARRVSLLLPGKR
jgi:hypothetical protein